MNAIFPWLSSAWEQLVRYKTNHKLPNALLISGAKGIGKSVFAEQFAQYVLCQREGNFSCGSCRSCQLFSVGNHPDYMRLQPEEESVAIKIDQVRRVVQFLNQTSLCSHLQVAVVTPAEGLNRAAANSLLKTLEEPRGAVLMILVCHKPALLPLTIRSRCQQINLAAPNNNQCVKWLAEKIGSEEKAEIFLSLADNLPLKALHYAENNYLEQRDLLCEQLSQLQQKKAEPVAVASQFLTMNFAEFLILMTTLVMDLIKLKLEVSSPYFHHRDKMVAMEKISHHTTLKQLFNYLDLMTETSRLLTTNTNVNAQLLLERLLIAWCYK